jgi:hypothetical protein
MTIAKDMQPDQAQANRPDPVFEHNRFMESLFVPHAAERRAQIYNAGQKPFARFSHYTSAEAALKIITQKQIWLRNASCMSDYREVEHGFSVLYQFFADEHRVKQFSDAIDAVAPGTARQALDTFNGWWRNGTLKFDTFIASVSEHDEGVDPHGRLSMWRAFGGQTPRVALILRVPYNSPSGVKSGLTFGPVAYFDDKGAEHWLLRVVQNVVAHQAELKQVPREQILHWVLIALLTGVTSLKHPGFHEEKEWRIVHSPGLISSRLLVPATQIVGGIPQIVYHLHLDGVTDPTAADLEFSQLFDRLIIGPSQYPIPMLAAFTEALTNAGVTDAASKIGVSHIPIRA